jgi:hypothetical protein
MCTKCKLQFGQHLADNQAQNDAPASSSIHQQCHHFNQNSNTSENSDKDAFPFQEFNSKELIMIQNALREKNNLINAKNEQSVTNNQNLINADNEINLINEMLCKPLLHIANKLLGRPNLNFDQLTPPEQKLWNLFENSDIYKFLTSEKDTIPEFRHNWITCTAKPKVTFDYQGFLDSWRAFNQQPQPQLQPTPALQRSISEPSPVHHNLRDRQNRVNYRALHLGQEIRQVSQELNTDLQQAAQQIKSKCKTMRKSVRSSAKATVTRLAPGAFLPRPTPPATTPSSPATTSSSSWNFWSSK